MKLHLDEDLRNAGIVVNREVEIRRGHSPGIGERTDIHVDAISYNATGDVLDRVTAIIETKGCWYRDLDSAMETQLENRYLKDNQCRHGIYLIGWFDCAQWDNGDYRNVPRDNVEEARVRFDEQAGQLSTHGNHVRSFVLNAALR